MQTRGRGSDIPKHLWTSFMDGTLGDNCSPPFKSWIDEERKEKYSKDTSIWHLIKKKNLDIREMLFGNSSLGGLLEAQGLDAVPSPTRRRPETCKVNGVDIEGDEEVDGKYFKGGYSLEIHGTSAFEDPPVGDVDSIQIEVGALHRCGATSCAKPASREVRDLARANYSSALATAITTFWNEYY